MFAGNFAPRDWAFCDGQLLPIAQFTALYSLLGTMYGGDGRTSFGLPDLRGRVAIHAGRGPGLSEYRQGYEGGAESVVLTQQQMPAHTHSATLRAHDGGPDTTAPAGNALGTSDSDIYAEADPDTDMRAGSITEQSVGGNQAHTNVQPYQCVNFVICLQGYYPPRD